MPAEPGHVFHVTDRRRDLVRVRLPAGVGLQTGHDPGDHVDQVVLVAPDGSRLGSAKLVTHAEARRRGAEAPGWVTDGHTGIGSLDDAVEVLLDDLP